MAILSWLLLGLLSTQVLAVQVHRFSTRSEHDKAILTRFISDHEGSEMWADVRGSHADVMLLDEHLAHADHLPLQRKVFIHDVENLMELSEAQEAEAEKSDFHAKYHSSSEYQSFLQSLATKHKNAEVVQVGQSVQGKPLVGIRLGDKAKPEILLQGGQHAREWIAPGSLAYAAEALISSPQVLQTHSVMLVPVVNPDGYDYTRKGSEDRLWRKNLEGYSQVKEELMDTQGSSEDSCFGADLNRNWEKGTSFPQVKQGEQVSNSLCSNTFQGKAPMSEKESASMSKYIQNRQTQGKGIAAFVDVHSYSQKIIPVGCNAQQMSASTHAKHLKLTQAVATSMTKVHNKAYSTGECAKVMYACSGVAHDWAHFVGKVPNSMAIELRDKGHYGFIVPPDNIKPTGQELVAAVHTIAQAHAEELMLERSWAEADSY